MNKKEFVKELENLISDYCRNNDEYEDVSDSFCIGFHNDFFNVSIEIDKETDFNNE